MSFGALPPSARMSTSVARRYSPQAGGGDRAAVWGTISGTAATAPGAIGEITAPAPGGLRFFLHLTFATRKTLNRLPSRNASKVLISATRPGREPRRGPRRPCFTSLSIYFSPMFFKTGKSSKEVGFLSTEMGPIIEQCRKQNALWFALAEDINRSAQATLTKYQIGPGEISGQHLFGLLLLIRSLSNFQGGLLMAERGMVVEARTLFRCCFENAFWLGALLKDGDDFIHDIMGDEVASTKSKVNWLIRDPSRLEFSGPNARARLQARVNEMEKEWGGQGLQSEP
jgi:hypothetical protein